MPLSNSIPDKKNILTEKQKREEIERDLKLNMFVEAGAGAGKTYLITKRITNMLMQTEPPVSPGEIVVITFTNAAAEELRNRIFKNVRREAERATDEGLRARLRDVTGHLDEMNISTIHSFCNVLLKEQAIAAGLPVDITVIEEDENNEIRERILNRYLSTLTEADWERMESVYPDRKERGYIRNAIRLIYSNRLDQPDDIEVFMPDEEAADRAHRLLTSADKDDHYEDIKARIEDFITRKAQSIRSDLTDFDAVLNDAKLPTSDLTVLSGVLGSGDACDLYRWLIAEGIGRKNKLFKAASGKAYTKENIDPANEEWKEFLNALLDEVFPPEKLGIYDGKRNDSSKAKRTEPLFLNILGIMMTHHAMKAADLYYRERPIAEISNDRLLQETYRLICNDSDDRALRYFSGKYTSFFVDEFQDTDSIQAGFIYRLASDLSDPDHLRLRDGSLFVVGDPKQSIYRFRGAQPEVYFDIKDRLKAIEESDGNAKVYELQFNYRTNNRLINWINEIFEDADGILTDEDGNVRNTDPENIMYIVDRDHPYIPMIPQKDVASDPKLIAGAYRYDIADSYQDINTDTGAYIKPDDYDPAEDVEAVKDLIKTLIDQKYRITDYKENENNEKIPYARDIRPSDFLLITPDTQSMSRYLDALKSVGIAVRLAGNTDLKTDSMFITYMRIYRHLINPRDSFYRMSAIEAIRESRLVDHAADADRYADELLDLLRYRTKGMSAYGTAEFLEKQLSVLVSKNGDRSHIDINSSMARIRQMLEILYERTKGNGISMIRAMEKYAADRLEHELSLGDASSAGDPGAVTFMNLHKTKGLEGRIVIIADRDGGRRWDEMIDHYRDRDRYYPGFRKGKQVWFSASAIKDANGETGYDKHRREEKAEFHRLEYVAVTRAEQAVIFMRTISDGCLFANRQIEKNGELSDGYDYRLNSLPDIRDSVVIGSYPKVAPKADRAYDLKRDELFAPISDEVTEDVRHKAIYDRLSPSGLEVKESERTVRNAILSEAHKAHRSVQDEQDPAMKRPADNTVGNVLHRTMELLVSRYSADLSGTALAALARICTGQAMRENIVDIQVAEDSGRYSFDEVERFIGACADSLLRWLAESQILTDAEAVYTELPFSYYEEAGDDPVFMKGNADLIIRYRDGRSLLIDYKSDNDWLIPEDRMKDVLGEKYAPQLDAYMTMITRLFGTDIGKISAGIVSFTQKDENGRLLPTGTVRTRYTDLTDTCNAFS